MDVKGKTIGFGLTGSHCTYDEVLPQMQRLMDAGASVIPVVSNTVKSTDSKFGEAEYWLKKIEEITGKDIVSTIPQAEPAGPENWFDVMVVAPCTGNSISKLANAMTESPVLMAAKATMRNRKPIVLAISTNDGLGLNAANIAKLMAAQYIYFVPFGQDAPEKKQNSLVARSELIQETCEAALEEKQLQPMIIEKFQYGTP